MGWCLFLLAVAAVYGCVTCHSDRSSVDSEVSPAIKKTADFINAALSQLSCKENCGDYVKPEDGVLTIEPQNSTATVNPVTEDDDYEPQYPDLLHPTTDNTPIDKSDICKSINKAAVVIESRHPDIASVKFIVLKELIRFTVLFSVALESEDCPPTVKLLDFIALAAQKLKLNYDKLRNYTCLYEEMTVTETTETSTSDYEQVSEDSHPVVTHESVTPKYETSEETSKKPCLNVTEHPETTAYESSTKMPEKPSTETSYETKSEKPCPEKTREEHSQTEEIKAEEDEYDIYPPFVGSLRGVPGEHYPNYTEIPITSFSCADKKYIPGFYADLETGCQVFHVCYKHRRESFLCPVGTIFNQPILACDYWYSSNCSLSPNYYEVNENTEEMSKAEIDNAAGELITNIIEGEEINEYNEDTKLAEGTLDEISKFLPVKVKVFEEISVINETKIIPAEKIVKHETEVTTETVNLVSTSSVISKTKDIDVKKPVVDEVEEVASDIFEKVVSTATRAVSKARDIIDKIPEPVEAEYNEKVEKPVSLMPNIIESAIPLTAETKLAAAVPVAKVIAAKAAVPLIAKAKLAVPFAKVFAAKAAVPVAKVVAAKAAVPVIAKAKFAVAAVPVAKVVAAKAAVPVIAKAKLAAVPVAKVVAVKAAVPVIAKTKIAAALPLAKVFAAKSAMPIVAKAKIAAVPAAKVVVAKAAAPIVAKAKAAAVVPVVAKSAIIAGKIASKSVIPIAAKAKVASTVPIAKAAVLKSVPFVAKAKFVATVPKVAVKGPVLKTKILAASLPFAKSAILKSTIPISKAKIAAAPVLKTKMFKTAAVPIAKVKFASVPFVKAKLFKAAAISPLTKKALALGYMKLLKAKKLAFMG